MSHHHNDEDSQMPGITNVDSNTRRRHSHTHLHIKPSDVINHIRSKVKRKRPSSNYVTEIPDFAIDNSSSGRTNSDKIKRSSQERNESKPIPTLSVTRSHPNISSQVTTEQHLNVNYDKKTNDDDNSSVEKNENEVFHTSDYGDRDRSVNETVQWRIGDNETDVDTNQKPTKSKQKPVKESKSVTESIKKRRQTVRRTVQSPSKIPQNKKTKGNGSNNMETSSHLSAFQIRDEDFNSIFHDLPSDEQLIVAYPCAWRKDIFMHGRMFLSANYLCFYTCFFKWEESLCIAYKDMVSVTREKSAKVLPNAIKLRTSNREQYLFASYIPRERIFIAIFRLWQNALLEKPLDYQQLRAIVYADQMSIDESTGDSEESITLDNNDEELKNQVLGSQSSLPLPLAPSKESLTTFAPPDRGTVSLPVEQPTYLTTCPCETHLARTYADRLFSYNVDKLFELTFGDNSFTRAFHDSQKLIDYTATEWHRNRETGKRERQVTYKTLTVSILGSNTISCTEKQVIDTEKPQLLYIINSEVCNEGMKYTDAFVVHTRFCMFQCDAKHTSLRVTAEVKYVKSVNAIAKSFIERNCHTNIEDGINNQVRGLENNQSTIHSRKSHGKHTSSSKRHAQKHHNDDISPDDISVSNSSSEKQVVFNEKMINEKGFFFNILLWIGICLLILHIYLCYKLYSLDHALYTSQINCSNQWEKKHTVSH